MNINILVNLLDNHNESSLLAINKLNPNKVIYIISKETQELYKDIEEYHKKNFYNIKIESILINEGDIENIQLILNKLSKKDTIINITGGKRINSLILLKEALIRDFKAIYIDVLNKQWYNFDDKLTISKDEFKDIYIEDMLNITGADLLMDSNDLSEKDDIINLTKKIYDNLEIWYKYKQKLHDTVIFMHDYENNKKVNVNINSLKSKEVDILVKCLDYIKNINGIEYKRNETQIEIVFLNDYLKGFIFKSGTWLEVLTNIVIREIREIDEVKSGVVFLWREGEQRVRNELDVLAIKDSVLICISCKDSEQYDENALNELDVYSKRLGGNDAKKILVATRAPCKVCINDRAKAMGINLVILDKDINNFRNTLKQIIKGK